MVNLCEDSLYYPLGWTAVAILGLILNYLLRGKKPDAIYNFPAGSWDYPNNGNLAPLDTITFTNGTQHQHLFDDTTEEFLISDIVLPLDLNPSCTVTFIAEGYAKTWAPGKKIQLKFYHSTVEKNGNLNTPYSSILSGDKALNSIGQNYKDHIVFRALVKELGWSCGDEVRIKLSRLPSSSSDSLVGDWGLTHFLIKIPRV